MRPVNLIPPEERRGDHAPLRAGALSYVIVGGSPPCWSPSTPWC